MEKISLVHVVLHMENIVEVRLIHEAHGLAGLAGVGVHIVGVGTCGGHGEDLAGQ